MNWNSITYYLCKVYFDRSGKNSLHGKKYSKVDSTPCDNVSGEENFLLKTQEHLIL